MAVLLTRSVYSAPYGYEFSSSRRRFHGSLTFAAGSYTTGGLLPNWDSATFVLNPTQTQSNVNVFAAGLTFPAVYSPTLSALTSNVVTLTVGNTLIAGQYVTFNGLTNLPFLNGLTLKVATRSATQFTVAFTHANVASGAETGNAVLVIGADTEWEESVSGSGYVYQYNKTTATVQIFIATPATTTNQLSELPAGALPAGVIADIIEFESQYVAQ